MKHAKNLLLLTGLLFAAASTPFGSPKADLSVPLKKAEGTAQSTADKVEPGDFNIYFRSNLDRDVRNYVWGWNVDTGLEALFPMSSADPVTFPELNDDTIQFLPLYLDYGVEYEGQSAWSSGSDITFQISEDNYFQGFVFRDITGSNNYKTKDFVIHPELIKKTEDGTINIYIDEDKGIYYDLAEFPTSCIDEVKYGEETVGDENAAYLEITPKVGKSLVDEIGSVDKLLLYRFYYTDGVKTNFGRFYFDKEKSILEPNYGKLYLEDGTLALDYNYELVQKLDESGNVSSAGAVSFLRYYSSQEFDDKYVTDKKLGAFIVGDTTVFRLWSPSATLVTLNLYPESQGTKVAHYDMHKRANGVYEIALKGNLGGYYYTFDIVNYGLTSKDTPDPYALSSNANGKRSMVVDFESLDDSESFDAVTDFTPDVDNAASISIMEMHTRDFTMDDSWNGSAENKGKFEGLVEEGTSVKDKDGTVYKTGFDYVKDLHQKGLTHVQIMPAFDFGSVDETRLDDPEYQNAPYDGIYNWGYDPQQYNAPEGSYSSDPDDGYARVEEFRDFVSTYNANGIGVVMDVVYNHMPAQSGSSFEAVFPGYYFRTSNYSGAGADIATQRTMVRKFIVDSVVSWVRNYHVAGFRFDLMGLIDLDTMKAVRAALDEIDPDILVYGEGWNMFQTDEDYGTRSTDMAVQTNLDKMGDLVVGAFNDDMRDALSGGNTDPNAYGYVQDAVDSANAPDTQKRDRLYYGLSGTYYVGSSGRFTYSTTTARGMQASIAYAECHDNMTLFDKFSISTADQSKVPLEVIMANDTVLASLSPAFFQIGQDFGKSKKITDEKYLVTNTYYADTKHGQQDVWYSHNSYNLSDDINAVDWNLLYENKDIKDRFDQALERRKANGALLGKDYDVQAFNDKDIGGYRQDLYQDSAVLSYSLQTKTGVYYFVQNYKGVAYTIPNTTITLEPYSAIARFVKN